MRASRTLTLTNNLKKAINTTRQNGIRPSIVDKYFLICASVVATVGAIRDARSY